MRRSKRIETLDQRPVNLDGYINEWPEMGFVAMTSPYDPKPSVKVANGRIVELDGKKREDFDFIDQFIADYAMNVERAEASMAVSSLEIARMIVDIHVSRKEILELVTGITPAKMTEVMNHLNVVELMMGMQKIRARRTPGNQAHITNLKDDPVQIAADAGRGSSSWICGGRDDYGSCQICTAECHGASDWFSGGASGCADTVLRRGSNRAGAGNPRTDDLCRDTLCIWNGKGVYRWG